MNKSHHLEHDIFVNTPIETLRDRLYAARCVASEPFERGGSGSAEHVGGRETAALNASPDAAFRHVDREPADYQDDWELPALPDEEAPAYGKFDRTRAYDTRTLRILAILEEHTDEDHALSAPRIKTMLDAQDHPGTRPPRVTTSSIRYSIQMLRSFGLNIAGNNHRGYALLSHPIDLLVSRSSTLVPLHSTVDYQPTRGYLWKPPLRFWRRPPQSNYPPRGVPYYKG